jgi:hypothetical protein
MTICTERELLRWAVEWRDKLFANPMDEEAWEALIGEDGCLDNDARAFLADTPACDAEKAVLVKLVEEQAAERHRWGGHAADGFGKEWRNCQSVLCQKGRDDLANLSPAAAALLAQGEEVKKLERTLARAQRIIGNLHIERADLVQRLAALAPGEPLRD